jgi:hemoglobin-like flavoprotein
MITDKQILLVKNSWSYVVTDAEAAGKIFYQRLFDVAPGVRNLFHGDIKFQARKLMNMVTLIVTKLHKLDEIMDEVKSLAVRHNRYGAEPAHYTVVGQCLLWTLEKGLGDKWNDETREAWVVVYGVLSDAMIKIQKEAVAA